MGGKRHPYRWVIIYGILLTGYAIFTLLDAFVIPRDVVYMEDLEKDRMDSGTGRQAGVGPQDGGDGAVAEGNQAGGATGSGSAIDGAGISGSEPDSGGDGSQDSHRQPVVTDTSYQSDNISIRITVMREMDTDIYVAEVTLADAFYLRAGLAGGALGRNINAPTSTIAEENNAILAINGDYYGFRERGFVMRNGYLYRTRARKAPDDQCLVIYEDGRFEILRETETDAETLAEAGAVQIFSFGPALVEEGEIAVGEKDEVEQAMLSNPRTAIGILEPLHYIFLVSDGRTEESEGLTLYELAQVMQELGCGTAYNLDGGGSSTMWFMGEVINHPTNGHRSGERSVSDIVYIGE